MKTRFEKEIKERFENFEVPYNPEAWKKIENKLNRGNNGTNIKMIGLISTLFVLFSTSYYFISKNENKVLNNSISEKESTNIQDSLKIENLDHDNIDVNSNKVKVNTQIATSTKIEKENLITEEYSTVKKVIVPDEFIIEPLNQSSLNNSDTDLNNKIIPSSKKTKFELPTITNKCQNEEIVLTNSNEKTIEITSPSNSRTSIEPGSQKRFKLSESGPYKLSFLDQQLAEYSKTFNVSKSENITLTIDRENTFKNGIPSITVSSNLNCNWFIENHLIEENTKHIDLHLYKKGNYDLTIETTNIQGCKSSKNESVKINEDYNLLAVSGFFPEDYNNQVNSFIPYALTQRNVKFTLIIIDPKDGHNIFETKDKLRPWDGIDPRNGQLVPQNSNWIWKVYIENPEKGENATYQGVIVRL